MKKLFKFLLANFQILNFLIASIVMAGIIYWYSPQTQSISNQEDKDRPVLNSTTTPAELQPSNLETDQNQDNNITPPASLPQPEPVIVKPQVKTFFGHFPFDEATPNRLVNMGRYYNRVEYLDIEAAEAFKSMKAEAQKEGIKLVLISGFRDEAVQKQLFARQIKRRGSKEAAAKLSAPSGHSEHHTGYAVDIGDAKQPKLDLKFEFESTAAYKWLVQNAKSYGFELSFTRDNPQGVSFEPWHWRYVGSTRAQEIFAASRSLSATDK